LVGAPARQPDLVRASRKTDGGAAEGLNVSMQAVGETSHPNHDVESSADRQRQYEPRSLQNNAGKAPATSTE